MPWFMPFGPECSVARTAHDKAIADLNEAIRLLPSYANYYLDRGQCWAAKEEYDKAIADLR